jgi:hypothetical protein
MVLNTTSRLTRGNRTITGVKYRALGPGTKGTSIKSLTRVPVRHTHAKLHTEGDISSRRWEVRSGKSELPPESSV